MTIIAGHHTSLLAMYEIMSLLPALNSFRKGAAASHVMCLMLIRFLQRPRPDFIAAVREDLYAAVQTK